MRERSLPGSNLATSKPGSPVMILPSEPMPPPLVASCEAPLIDMNRDQPASPPLASGQAAVRPSMVWTPRYAARSAFTCGSVRHEGPV